MISVIISIYNAENDLHRCLNSILRQTYEDFEIICVDDASTDSSSDILEYFSKKDSRVKILKNYFYKGLGYCRNIALNEANGDYVIFLNGGDWLRFNAFEKLIDKAEENQLDVLFFRSVVNDNQGNLGTDDLEDSDIFKFENKVFNHFDLDKNSLFKIKNNISNKLYSKSFLNKNNIDFPYENRIDNEIPFLLKVITSANKISFLDERLHIFHEKEWDLSNSNPERLFDCFDIIYYILDVFLDDIQLYVYYKNVLLDYIFGGLNELYSQIDGQYKERFFIEIQNVFKHLIKNHGLYDDIIDNIDEDILNRFKFDEIMHMINNPPKISIIMPVYNTEGYLPKVLDSIVKQTIGIDNIEVIIIDDCSTDNSWEIIEEYSRNYDTIFSIPLYENSGSPSKARNIGIRSANSNYLMFHDSDDCSALDGCEILYDVMIGEDVDFVCGMMMRNDNTEGYDLAYAPWNLILSYYEEFVNEDVEKLLESKDLFKLRINSIEDNKFVLADYHMNSKLLKKSLFMQNKIRYPEDLSGGEDSVVLFECLIKSKSFVFVNKVVFCYDVQRPDSLIHDFSFKTIQSRSEAYKLMYDIAILNNKKDLFIEVLLWRKLDYWIKKHLIMAPVLDSEDILSLFKSYQILFCECLSYPKLPKLLKGICKDIKEGSFEDAVSKIMDKRAEYANSNEKSE